jgi:hypothetical protein
LQDAWRGDVRRLLQRVRVRVQQEREPERRAAGERLLGYLRANAEGIA